MVMQNTSTSAELKFAIELLEAQCLQKKQQLKQQLAITFDSLKPINIIKNTIQDIASSPIINDSLLGTLIGLVTGYVTKKIAVGTSHNLLRKIIGSFLQVGVSTVVSKHSETIITIGKQLYQRLFQRKETQSSEL